MKTISYRGGIVRFRIPKTWAEEYEEKGGGMFYEDKPDSSTLRLNVLTYRHSTPVDDQVAIEMLRARTKEEEQIVRHADGRSSISHWIFGQENDEQLAIRYWYVANLVPPHHVRIAIFSYAILESQTTDGLFVEEAKMIDQEIRTCRFAKELGI